MTNSRLCGVKLGENSRSSSTSSTSDDKFSVAGERGVLPIARRIRRKCNALLQVEFECTGRDRGVRAVDRYRNRFTTHAVDGDTPACKLQGVRGHTIDGW